MDLENHEQWLNPPLSTPPEDVLDAAKLVVYRSVIANGLNMSPDEADILVETTIFAALPFIMKWFINSLPALTGPGCEYCNAEDMRGQSKLFSDAVDQLEAQVDAARAIPPALMGRHTADTQRVARKPVVDELTQRTLGYIKGDS